jgi:RimJ/RimL family protein N-acetyltransferase
VTVAITRSSRLQNLVRRSFTGPVHTPPSEIFTLAGGKLSRVRELDGEQFALAVHQSLEHLRPWMPWANAAAAQVEAQRTRGREAEQQWAQGTDYLYALRPDTGDVVIGDVVIGAFGLHRRIGPGGLEIGYWLHADWTGHGHATAAASALTAAALALPDIEHVEIHTDEANTASAAIPLRLGYRLDRIESQLPEAPAKTGRQQIWITTEPPL